MGLFDSLDIASTPKRSFDTVETSTSLYSEDLLEKHIPSLLESDSSHDGGEGDGGSINDYEDKEVPSTVAKNHEGTYIGGGDDDESIAIMQLPRAYKVVQTPDSVAAKKKQPAGRPNFADEPSVGAILAQKNKNKPAPLEQDESSITSLSSFYRGLIGLKNLISPWKEDKPFDEESILESELGEGVEAIYGIGVYTGFRKGRNKDPSIPNGSVDRSTTSSMPREVAVTCRTMKDDSEPRRRRKPFICCLLCLLLIILIMIVALSVGLKNARDDSENGIVQANSAQAPGDEGASGDGSNTGDGKEPAMPTTTMIPTSPSAMPSYTKGPNTSNAPSFSPTLSSTNAEPTGNDSTTKSPVSAGSPPTKSPTRSPSASPTKAPTPNPTKAPSAGPTQHPTRHPTAHPTQHPSISPTKATSSPTRAPVPRPTPLPTPNPTRSPTPLPTRSPTARPTPAPSVAVCQNRITVEKFCHEDSDDLIVVDFVVCNPQRNDWVGIYPDGSNPNSLGRDYVTWAWTCGSRNCGLPFSRFRFAFATDNIDTNQYRAFLIPGSEENPYQSVARSEPFIVARNC